MEFLSEIYGALRAESCGRVRYTVVQGGGGYFENVRRLVAFSEREIVLRGRSGGGVRVTGTGLSLGKYYAGDLLIRGEIERVERES